ncbi:MAG: aldehyde dehydrogenase [Oscillospiraceae bacterium]
MKMLINGRTVDSSDGGVIVVTNPATGEFIDNIPSATERDIKDAVKHARQAQKLWAKVPINERSAILMKFVAEVEADREVLALLLSNETGKALREARAEIYKICFGFTAFCEKVKHIYGEVIPAGTEPGQERNIAMVQREPVGVVACIIPFNFPGNMITQKVAPALLCGNSAIIKPATDNPLTLCRLALMLQQAGVTPGAIQVVTGRGSTVGTWLCSDPGVNLVTLTGSTEVGIETAKVCAENLTRVSLELGGNDAFIVMDDADLDLAAEEAVAGRMANSGQVCSAPKRFLVQRGRTAEFEQKVISRLSAIKQGTPDKEDTTMGCLISEKAACEVEEQVNRIIEQGGRLLFGGKRDGAFYTPTLVTDVPKTAEVASDAEIFGPVMPIIPFDTEEEAVEIANNSIYGLSGAVFSRDIKTAFRMLNALDTGMVVINGSGNQRTIEMPFGGYKKSGIGTEGVISTFEEMTRKKTIVLKNIL